MSHLTRIIADSLNRQGSTLEELRSAFESGSQAVVASALTHDSNPPLTYDSTLVGTFPGTTQSYPPLDPNGNDNPRGDLIGLGVSINRHQIITSALGAAVQGRPKVGAVYYFGPTRKACPDTPRWRQDQPPTYAVGTPDGQGPANGYNRLGGLGCASAGDWAFFSLVGTPDTVDSDNFLGKENIGEVVVFRRNGPRCNRWRFWQRIPAPAEVGLLPNPEFGLNLSYRGGDWLLVGGGRLLRAYIYRRHPVTSLWTLVNSFTPPYPSEPTPPIPGNLVVAISPEYAFVGTPQTGTSPENASVFVFPKENNATWSDQQDPSPSQTLTGFDNPPLGVSDFFGGTMIIDDGWALIGAPADSGAGPVVGAAYFYRLQPSGQWQLAQKVYPPVISTDPATPTILFGFSVALHERLAVIGNPFRSRNSTTLRNEGSAFVYRRAANGTWSPVQEIFDPNPSPDSFFGGGGSFLDEDYLAISNDYATGAIFGAPALPINGRLLVFRNDAQGRDHAPTRKRRRPCRRVKARRSECVHLHCSCCHATLSCSCGSSCGRS